jgi:CspA family cold shock protein
MASPIRTRRPGFSKMASGTCLKWFAERGYGFIQPDDGGAEIPVHRGALASRADRLAVDQRVTFEIEINRAGKPQARQVAILAPIFRSRPTPAFFHVGNALPTWKLPQSLRALFALSKLGLSAAQLQKLSADGSLKPASTEADVKRIAQIPRPTTLRDRAEALFQPTGQRIE